MIYQAKNVGEFKMAAEILYALDAVSKLNGNYSVSRVAIQKVMYLSVVLAPIKNLAIELANFIAHYQGPYNKHIQNTIDHLVGTNYVELESYKRYNNRLLANYTITKRGRNAIEKLRRMPEEEEKQWWISIIVRLSNVHLNNVRNSRWEGFDRIVDLVYADPTFSNHLQDQGRGKSKIDFDSTETKELISYAKNFIGKDRTVIKQMGERKIAEMILVGFFDFMLGKHLEENDK
ncbi:hypothetical protein [Fulvivirga sp.]|uniref:hypothetical protein n=1 Tax=Fulvivirga sp. TaxID=1931237 RepID=UPI0032ED62AB